MNVATYFVLWHKSRLSLTLTGQVRVVFGSRVVQHTLALCEGHFSYLELLPRLLQLRILSFLDLEDIARLGQTSRAFREVTTKFYISWE